MKRSDTLIPLGFEVGTGEPVSIPLRNLCITGQTQEAGKTTALEGIVSRCPNARAIAFVTKRHESGFGNARRIAPYFRERADWQFVASILEATLKQRMNFQRSWIMKLCESKAPTAARSKRGTGSPGWLAPRTLADVAANVEVALQTATGIHEGVYTELRGYLRMVVPQIDRLPYSTELRLEQGLNVMDLVEYSSELQSLVVRSVLEWIYEQESDTITVIPEAWEFIPQKRGSPVKLAAESLIRKGSAGRNYIFLDSQDLANVDKDIVRSCPVMLLGVQRERNEIKRTLDHLPGSVQKKPKPSDIMSLGLGQYYVCHGAVMRHVYVQPAWLSEAEARMIATGQLGVGEAQHAKPRPQIISNESEDAVYRERWEDEKRRREDAERRLAAVERELRELRHGAAPLAEAVSAAMSHAERRVDTAERAPAPGYVLPLSPANGDAEAMYSYIRDRLAAEAPTILRIAVALPEIEIEVKRETIRVDGNSVKGRIAELIRDGFFRERRQAGTVHKKLLEAGLTVTRPAVNQVLDELTLKRFFTRMKDDHSHVYYKAIEGVKVNVIDR